MPRNLVRFHEMFYPNPDQITIALCVVSLGTELALEHLYYFKDVQQDNKIQTPTLFLNYLGMIQLEQLELNQI